MRIRISLLVVALVAALGAIGVPSASAATEFGDSCVGNQDFEDPVTLFESSAPLGNPLPVAAPSAGVVTQWKVNVVPVPITFPQTMKILRLNGGSHTAQVVGEAAGAIGSGQTVLSTRIPVQAGDRVSLFGSGIVETLICDTPGVNTSIGGFAGNGGGVGSSNPYIELPEELRIPVAAVIESDADNDGYGDETQDKCPQSATTHDACPSVTIDAFSLKGKGTVTVLVAVSGPAAVSVTGTVKLGKGKTAKLKAPTKSLTPGPIGKFKLKFPGSLKGRLKELEPKQSLQMKIAASATNVAGAISSDNLKVKLKGEG
jgi:hypothetical protein